MKKKILSVILCVVMLASTLAVTVGAYTPLASLGSVSDKSCVKLTTGTAANHSTTIHFGSTITQDSTVTFYFKPEASTWSAQNGFPIILINADWAHTLAADALAADKERAKAGITGVEIAAQIIKECRPYCQGVHIMALGWEAKVPELLKLAGI